tara:strand:- start:48 stop:461 length:414 start_codon:yes stop_codon:yes gene_type:complete
MILFTISTVKADTEIQVLLRAIKIPDGFILLHQMPYDLTALGKSNNESGLTELMIYGELDLVNEELPHPDGAKYNKTICGLKIIDITDVSLNDHTTNYFSSIRLLDKNFDTTELIIISNESFALRRTITSRLCEKVL